MEIKINKLTKTFGSQKIIENFSLHIEKNGILCLFGPSGSGKTTLLNILAGITEKDSGSITGLCPDTRISFVFQDERLLPWLTALENVKEVMTKHSSENAFSFLEKVNLDKSAANKLPSELSGGMQRRVSIARALAFCGELMLLDEPFTGLDGPLKKNIMNLFYEYSKTNTIIMITHDDDEALLLSDRILVLDGPPLNIRYDLPVHIPYSERKYNTPELNEIRQKLLSAKP